MDDHFLGDEFGEIDDDVSDDEPRAPSTRGRKTITVGRLLLATAPQAAGAPIIDRSVTEETKHPYRHWRSLAIHLTPWRRNEYGDRAAGLALVFGWEHRKPR